MPSHLRTTLQEKKLSLGSWLQFPSPDTAELMAHMGYDWLVIDMEHGSIDISQLPNLLRAIASGGAQACAMASPEQQIHKAPLALVRVPTAEKLVIRRALDAGAHGLIFPMIQSRATLDAAIDVALYPHKSENTGSRGVGYARANAYGKNFGSYMQAQKQGPIIIAQIEHADALADLDAILRHPYLDAIMVGPYDLSASMGIMGDFSHPLFLQAMDEIQKLCRQHNVPMGSHVVTPEPTALQNAIDAGHTFIAYGIDAVFLWQHAARPTLHKN